MTFKDVQRVLQSQPDYYSSQQSEMLGKLRGKSFYYWDHSKHNGVKTCWDIVNKSSTDDRTKLQATAIISDSYKYVMDLTTNGAIVTDAIK